MFIQQLDPRTAKQIAAGEVVENPASVVKELVENSLDAGAKRIAVTIKGGGLKEITVIDNGCGIAANEVSLAMERHATSKIRRLIDLQKVYTLGFRGEALPSIAAVSRMTITTRHRGEETGRTVFLEGGQEKENKEIGFAAGTKITVKDLFYNTPVRLKFLKGVSAETAKISRAINVLALSRPDVTFILKKDNNVLLEIPGDGDLLNAILQIFGRDLARELNPLYFQAGEFTLNGYVSNPAYSRNSRYYQLFYINGRYVRSRLVKEALDQSFAGVVTAKRYPAAFLYLTVPAASLDVNIHPSKTEVRFHQAAQLRGFLVESLRKAFSPQYFTTWMQKSRLPKSSTQTGKGTDALPATEKQQGTMRESVLPNTAAYDSIRESCRQLRVAENRENDTGPDPGAAPSGISPEWHTGSDQGQPDNAGLDSIKSSILETALFTGNFLDGIITGQVFSTYIILQKDDCLILIDQHAAHERVLWEKIQQLAGEKEKYVQEILPFPLEFPAAIAAAVNDKTALLKDIGLVMEQFGNNTFIIRTVPFFLKDIFTGEMLRDILEDMCSLAPTKDLQKETLLQLSCKAAVKAKKQLSPREIDSLLAQLAKCKNPFFCPHGRPVAIKISQYELEKHFKRRG